MRRMARGSHLVLSSDKANMLCRRLEKMSFLNKPAESRLPLFGIGACHLQPALACLTTMYRCDSFATGRKCCSICSTACSHWSSWLLQINREGRGIGFMDLRENLAIFWLVPLCGWCRCKVYLARRPFDPGAQRH